MAQIEFVKDSNSNFFIIYHDFGRRKDRLVQISVKRIYMKKNKKNLENTNTIIFYKNNLQICTESLSNGPVVITASTGALQVSSLGSIPNWSTIITVNRVRNFHPKRNGQRIRNIFYNLCFWF